MITELNIPGIKETLFLVGSAEEAKELWNEGRGVKRGRILTPKEMERLKAVEAQGATKEDIRTILEAKLQYDANVREVGPGTAIIETRPPVPPGTAPKTPEQQAIRWNVPRETPPAPKAGKQPPKAGKPPRK